MIGGAPVLAIAATVAVWCGVGAHIASAILTDSRVTDISPRATLVYAGPALYAGWYWVGGSVSGIAAYAVAAAGLGGLLVVAQSLFE